MITSRKFETTVSDVQRSVTMADDFATIRDVMNKNDFAQSRTANIVTQWAKPIPPEAWESDAPYRQKEDFIYAGEGEIVVTMMGFEGNIVTLYRRYGKLGFALEKHIEFVNLFAAGML